MRTRSLKQKVKQTANQRIKRPKMLASARSHRFGAPKGIRIPVFALKGQRPRPLDDGGEISCHREV